MKIVDADKYLVLPNQSLAKIAELQIFENYVRWNCETYGDGTMYNTEDKKWSDKDRISVFPRGRYKIVGKQNGKMRYDKQMTERYAEVAKVDIGKGYAIPKPIDDFMLGVTGYTIKTTQEIFKQGEL